MTVREFVVAQLGTLPKKWRVIGSMSMPEVIDRPTVVIKHTALDPLPEAPLSHFVASVTLTVADPQKDTARAEDALDDEVGTLCLAIMRNPHISFQGATKVTVNQYLAWDVRIEITSAIDPPTTTPEEA